MDSPKSTEQLLREAVIAYQVSGPGGKMTMNALAAAGGISRQSVNKFYKHLVPYARGQAPISELLGGSTEVHAALESSQAALGGLRQRHEKFVAETEARIQAELDSHLTTLMCGDIALHESKELRLQLEKQALHNDLLVKDKLRLETELTHVRAEQLKRASRAGPGAQFNAIAVAPDLRKAFHDYVRSDDRAAFEEAKDRAMDEVSRKVLSLCKAGTVALVVVVDRYLLNFERHVERVRSWASGEVVVIRAPILSRQELRLFIERLVPCSSVEVHFPVCTNESVLKAQRQFLFREVPQAEKEAADQMLVPVVQDGYDRVLAFLVKQGD